MSVLTYLAGVAHAAGRVPRRFPGDTRSHRLGPPVLEGAIAVAVNRGERKEVLVRLLDEIEAVIAADEILPLTPIRGAQA